MVGWGDLNLNLNAGPWTRVRVMTCICGFRIPGEVSISSYIYAVGVRQAGKSGHAIAVRRGHCASMRVWLKVQYSKVPGKDI